MIAVDKDISLTLTGNGDVFSEEGVLIFSDIRLIFLFDSLLFPAVVAIGSGGVYAQSAARALIDIPG